MSEFPAALERPRAIVSKLQRRLVWQPTPAWAAVIALAFLAAFTSLGRPSAFLYFQF